MLLIKFTKLENYIITCYDRKRLRLTASLFIGAVRAVGVVITHPCQRNTLAHCTSTRELLGPAYPLLWNTQQSSINNVDGTKVMKYTTVCVHRKSYIKSNHLFNSSPWLFIWTLQANGSFFCFGKHNHFLSSDMQHTYQAYHC